MPSPIGRVRGVADGRGDGTGNGVSAYQPRTNAGTCAEQHGHRCPRHHRHCPGGEDADGGHLRHFGHRWATNVSYNYQWIRNDGTSDTDIQNATGSNYTLVDVDEGKTIKVRVSFTDDAGNGESLTSQATVSVAARPNSPATGAPTISGTAQVGETAPSGHA